MVAERANEQLDRENRENRLQRSWRANADAWARAVRERRIASRVAGTDEAILDAVLGTRARRILDLGCGEGWLARALTDAGREVVGIDASPELVAAAHAHGGARFALVSYADLAAHAQELGRFDAAVCNFALLGEDIATPLLALHDVLEPDGHLIVQTVHPWAACGDDAYADGWRIETFAAFGDDFREPMPWYFRTLSSWFDAMRAAGFTLERAVEPVDAATGRPLSLLLCASLQNAHTER
jgi:2-polyprenyl-3-methyl-5-hydroxy-6-metoxy-1,4-benzoquinol methylase